MLVNTVLRNLFMIPSRRRTFSTAKVRSARS